MSQFIDMPTKTTLRREIFHTMKDVAHNLMF